VSEIFERSMIIIIFLLFHFNPLFRLVTVRGGKVTAKPRSRNPSELEKVPLIKLLKFINYQYPGFLKIDDFVIEKENI
jgi:hypothetical protein